MYGFGNMAAGTVIKKSLGQDTWVQEPALSPDC